MFRDKLWSGKSWKTKAKFLAFGLSASLCFLGAVNWGATGVHAIDSAVRGETSAPPELSVGNSGEENVPDVGDEGASDKPGENFSNNPENSAAASLEVESFTRVDAQGEEDISEGIIPGSGERLHYRLVLKNYGGGDFTVKRPVDRDMPIIAFSLDKGLKYENLKIDGKEIGTSGALGDKLNSDLDQVIWGINNENPDDELAIESGRTTTFTLTLELDSDVLSHGDSLGVMAKGYLPGMEFQRSPASTVTVEDYIYVDKNRGDGIGHDSPAISGTPVEREIVLNNASRGDFNGTFVETLNFSGLDSLKIENVKASGSAFSGMTSDAPKIRDKGNNTVEIEISNVFFPKGKHSQISYQLIPVVAGAAAGTVKSTLTVTPDAGGSIFSCGPSTGIDKGVNRCAYEFTVVPAPLPAGAFLKVTFIPDVIDQGEQTTLTVYVENTSGDDPLAIGDIAIDVSGLGGHFRHVGHSGAGSLDHSGNDSWLWAVGTLAAGQKEILEVVLEAETGLANTGLHGVAVETADGVASNCGSENSDPGCVADVMINSNTPTIPAELKAVKVEVVSDKPKVMPEEELQYTVTITDPSAKKIIPKAVVSLDVSSINKSTELFLANSGPQGSVEHRGDILEWTLGNDTEQKLSLKAKVKEDIGIGTKLTLKFQDIALDGATIPITVTGANCAKVFALGSHCIHTVTVVEDSRDDPAPGINGLLIKAYAGVDKSPKVKVRQGDEVGFKVVAENGGPVMIADTVIEDSLKNIIGSADIVEGSLVGFVQEKGGDKVIWPKLMPSLNSLQGADDDDDDTDNFIKPGETLTLSYKVKVKENAKPNTTISNRVTTSKLPTVSEQVTAGDSNCAAGKADDDNCSATVTILAAEPRAENDDKLNAVKDKLASAGLGSQTSLIGFVALLLLVIGATAVTMNHWVIMRHCRQRQ